MVTVHNVATKQNGEFDEIFGTAVAPDPNFPGELEVTFPGSKWNITNYSYPAKWRLFSSQEKKCYEISQDR